MSVCRNRVVISAMVLALLISVSAIAQERMSPQLADFLRFVDANHFSRMTEAQYNSMTPAEWAWILGKAYETEFEWAFTNTNNRTRDEKMLYLMLLWEELQDYVTEASARYTEKEYSGPYLRAYLMHGFYGFDQNGTMERYYQWLGLNSPIPSKPLVYGSTNPAGGVMNHPEGYRQPWKMSFEDFAGTEISQGRYLERPSEVYTKHFYPKEDGIAPNDDLLPVQEEEEVLGEAGALDGRWRLQLGSNYSEWIFSGGPKTGSFSATNYVNGKASKKVSGQYEGYRRDQNGYYEYKLYHDGEESRLTIIKDTGSQLILDVWSSRFTLQRVE